LLRVTRGVITALLWVASGSLTAQEPSRSVREGVYSDAQAARGAEGFAQNCAVCHGASLGGVGEAPGLIGGQFMSDFDGLTVAELFDRIRSTMPMTAPGSLKREQYAEILAFVLKANGFPAGSIQLDYRSEYLSDIRFQPPESGAPAPPTK
jgi:S-disulfanyl-L-cysteine oxidoreductase SoxD